MTTRSFYTFNHLHAQGLQIGIVNYVRRHDVDVAAKGAYPDSAGHTLFLKLANINRLLHLYHTDGPEHSHIGNLRQRSCRRTPLPHFRLEILENCGHILTDKQIKRRYAYCTRKRIAHKRGAVHHHTGLTF